MQLEKIDFGQLKKMALALNTAKYKDGEEEKNFYTGKTLKTIAISKEDLAKNFDAAIKSIADEVVNDLPEEIIDFYNEFFSAEEGAAAEAAPAAEAAAAEAKPAEDAAAAAEPVKEKKEKKEKAPKEPKPPKEKKEKKEVELSVFGHKMGTQSAALDALLVEGTPISLDELSKKSGRSPLGVKGHIKHLRDSRKLNITEKDGMYQYVKA